MKTQILNAEPEGYSQTARDVLDNFADVHEWPVTQKELPQAARFFDALIVRLNLRVTDNVFETSALSVVATATTGLDHIDLKAAAARDIDVVSLQGETEFLQTVPASAEHTWALMMALLRRVPWAFDDVKAGGWNRDKFRGHDLSGMRLGIIGRGRVGSKVARYALAFDMEVKTYDPHLGTDSRSKHWECGSLEELLLFSDIVTVHVPLNDETENMLDRDMLSILAPGSYLLNTSRGAIVNESALVGALESGRLAGAAIDVLSVEPPDHHALAIGYARAHDNLLITPHLAGATVESMGRTEVFIAEKLRKMFA